MTRGNSRYRNTLFEQLAGGSEAGWAAWAEALLNVDAAPAPLNISAGCDTGYKCAQNIAAPMAWLMLTGRNGSFLGFERWSTQIPAATPCDPVPPLPQRKISY